LRHLPPPALSLSDHAKRWSILIPTAPLPRPWRVRSREHLLTRLDWARARRADLLLVAHPKSGTTWLRVMISRLYQQRYGLPSSVVVKSDELALHDPALPHVLATNGHYSYEGIVGELLAADAPESPLHSKKVLLLVRHPCDIAVSWYFQFTRRQSAWKQELVNHSIHHPIDRHTVTLWDFVMRSELGLASLIDYLNTWERNVARLPHALVVRYEDLRAQPREKLREVADLLDAGFSDAEIEQAVAFGSFENQRRLETQGHYRRGGMRLRDARDPQTFKVRRGVVGGYRDYFTAEQVAEMERLLVERLSPSLGYADASDGAGSAPGPGRPIQERLS
jgi:hypothetical protein